MADGGVHVIGLADAGGRLQIAGLDQMLSAAASKHELRGAGAGSGLVLINDDAGAGANIDRPGGVASRRTFEDYQGASVEVPSARPGPMVTLVNTESDGSMYAWRLTGTRQAENRHSESTH